MNDITLFIPVGYGRGTIIYDLEGKPFEVGELLNASANIRYVHPIESAYAEMRVKNGAKVLVSE